MKNLKHLIVPFLLGATFLGGCNQAPEASANEPVKNTGRSEINIPEQPVQNKPDTKLEGKVPNAGANIPPTNPDQPVQNPANGNGTSGSKAPSKLKSGPKVEIAAPETMGWRTAKVDPIDLGSKFDRALSQLTDSEGAFQYFYKDAEQSGADGSNFFIGKNSAYRIDFFIANKPIGIRRIISNGVKRQILNDGWSNPSATPKTEGESDPKTIVKDWPNNFPRMIFYPVTERKTIWKPLIRGLKDQKYTIKVEVQDAMVQGKNRTLYRYIMIPPDSKLPKYEIKFDGIRMVPLTVNMVFKDTKGIENQRQWTAKWAFDAPPSKENTTLPSDAAKNN